MVFYYFGTNLSSWAFGNDKFSLARNLPPALQAVWDGLGEPFQDKQMAGTRIEWMSTAPDGRYAVMTKNGDLMSNCTDLLDTVKVQLQQVYGTSVHHVAFSPLGGWFVRYGDGTVQLCGRFPDAFYSIASPFLSLSEAAARSRQTSLIQYVFFGADHSVVVKVATNLHYDNVSQALVSTFNSLSPNSSRLLGGFSVGKGTVLCPWSSEYFFVEAEPSFGGAKQYPFCLPDKDVSQELMLQVTSNLKPPQDLIPKGPPRDGAPTASAPQNPIAQGTGNGSTKGSNSRAPGTVTDLREIPRHIQAKYGARFDAHSYGRGYIPGAEAAPIFLGTGLSTKALSEIWDLADVDKNGRLDREEFIRAMWLIDSREDSKPPPTRWTEGGLRCDACLRGVKFSEAVYFCAICQGGNFDICCDCYESKGETCNHSMQKSAVKLNHEPGSINALGDHLICDGCGTNIYKDSLVYWCQWCNGGDYEVCEDCWASNRNCGHDLSLKRVDGAVSGPGDLKPTSSSYYNQGYHASGAADQVTTHKETSEIDKLSKQFNDTKLRDSLLSSIVSEKPNVQWDDVAGLETAKSELQEAIIFPIHFPQMFRGKRQPRRALLLYGPPGTGKSYLAKAVATEVDHTLFSISSSDIMSKWMGESEGLMKQLFELAREKKPSIIFIDEIDAICGKRESGGASNEDTARMKTEFLVQMDGLGNNNDGVFVLAATNLPWLLDPAVRRRFQKRIHVPLPDEDARRRLFEVHLGDMGASLGQPDQVMKKLATMTEGYSGSDIANIVQDALMIPIRKVHSATHFRKVRDRDGEWYTPCHRSAEGALAMRWNKVPPKQLREPVLEIGDLTDALSKVRPSVGEEEVMKCDEWTKQYGLEGA